MSLLNITDAVKVASGAKVAIVIVIVKEDVNTCGEGHDRISLDLPGKQPQLLQAIHFTETPMVVVLLNGRYLLLLYPCLHRSRPLSIPWMKDNADAIIE